MVKVKYLFIPGRDAHLGDVTTGGIYETTEEIAKKLVATKRYEYMSIKEDINIINVDEIKLEKKVKNKNR